MSEPTALSLESRVLLRSALLLWLLAGVSTVWEVLALQGPDSPVRLGVLAGPIGQLRGFSFALGAVLFGAAWAFPRLYPVGRGRVALGLLVLGALLHTTALAYAASQGMVGAQIFDPRPDALLVVVLRGLGHLAMLAALVDALIRSFRA